MSEKEVEAVKKMIEEAYMDGIHRNQDRKSRLTPKLLVISIIVFVVLCLLANAFLPS